jgi:hypothetical protein
MSSESPFLRVLEVDEAVIGDIVASLQNQCLRRVSLTAEVQWEIKSCRRRRENYLPVYFIIYNS